jgi:PAS domain S-box-containing protein
VLILEADGTIRYASPSHLRLLGYTPAQMEGHNAAEFVHPADLPAVQDRTVATARVRDAVETMIFRIRHADGSWRTLEAIGANRLRDPVVRGWIVTSRDITDRLRMETEIRQSEVRLRGIINGSSAMICLTDLDGRYVLVNREVERFYGRERTAIEGQIAYDVLPAEVRDLHRIQDRLVIERNAEVAAEEQVLRDGALRTYLMQKFPLRDEHGVVAAIAGIATDITPRAQIEAALQERERQLAEAQRVAHIGSFEWDAVANRVSWSDELYRIYGLDPQSFGATFDAFVAQVHPDDQALVVDTIQQAIAAGGPFQMQERIVRPSGEVRYLSSWGEVVRDAQGRPVRLLGICQDVTTQRQQEEEVRRLNETLEQRVAERTAQLREANEQLEAFSYSVSHDLRAPLRAMQGFAAALLEDYADQLDAEGQEYAQRIDAAAARMDLLIADLLAYSRLSRAAITVQPIALDAVVASALAQVEEELRQRQAQVRVTPGLPRVSAHYATLVQVVANLLTNAAKFVAPNRHAAIAVEAEARGSWIRLWVIDNGIGIAPEHRERIFGVFERLHGVEAYPGTGIGLAIVRKGIERLGGHIGLESTVGMGSRFWIELPAAEEPAA